MAALTSNTIAATYLGLLKTSDSAARGAEGSADQCSDGAGNTIPLYVSETEVYAVGSGTGTSHTAFGKNCGVDLAAGTGNSLFGEGAGADVSTGEHNVAVGYHALFQGTTETDDNVAIGYNAMSGAIVGESVNDCVAIGSAALSGALDSSNGILEASGTVAIGTNALTNITTGAGNVAVGHNAGNYNATGGENTYLGYQAGYGASGQNHSTNTAVGFKALYDITDGAGNVAVGKNALFNVAGGDYNVGIGEDAGRDINTGEHNIAIGYHAGLTITDHNRNIAIGTNSLDAAVDGGGANVAIGFASLGTLNHDAADENVAIGSYAGEGATTMLKATIVGASACGSGTITSAAEGIVAVGHSALKALTIGVHNTAIGANAMLVHTTGGYNIAIGSSAMDDTDNHADTLASEHNIFIGKDSGGGTWITNDSNKNIGLGNYTMDAIMNGALSNIAIGHEAGSSITSGANNVLVGNAAGETMTTGTSQTCIGYNAQPSAVDASEQIVIGSGTTGVADNTVTLGNASVTDVYMSQDSGAYIHSQTVNDHVANTMSAPYYRFDGINDEIAVEDNANLRFGATTYDTAFSISVWINMEDATDFPIITKGTYNSDAEWRLQLGGTDKLEFTVYDESLGSTYETAYTTAALTAYEGKWIHVCATYNGVGGASANAGMLLYVNGVSQALTLTADGGTYVAMDVTATDEVRIGNYNDATYGRGSISKLQMFNVELSAADVKENYSGASVPFKYQGANQTNLITGAVDKNWGTNQSDTGNDTNDKATFNTNYVWNTDGDITNITVASSVLTFTAGVNGGIYYPELLVNGKAYRVTIATDSITGTFKLRTWHGAGYDELGTLAADTINKIEFVVPNTSAGTSVLYIQATSGGTIALNAATVPNSETIIGAVAEYDGSGMGASRWDDKSGNRLYGTVSGATVENAPADADSGLTYEEGTFTPTILFETGHNIASYTTQVGYYTKIGRLVNVEVFIKFEKTAGTNNTTIEGLPFTSGAKTHVPFPLVISDYALVDGFTTGEVRQANSDIMLGHVNEGGDYDESNNGANISNTSGIIISMVSSYWTD